MDGKFKNSLRLLIAALLSTVIILVGCQKEMPFTPSQTGGVVTRSTHELTFLKSKTARLNKLFTAQQLITVAQGGIIETGDSLSGYSSLIFKPGDLPQDTIIFIEWDSQGYISELGPHGIVFNSPVALKLSYKDVDLTNVIEDSLKIWYYNDVTDLWELVGGTVNKTEKYVTGYIGHFSRYALGAE